jgi:hypothetical protein
LQYVLCLTLLAVAASSVLTHSALSQRQTSPVDVRIVIDPFTPEWQYLQSDILNVTIFFTNARDEPTLIHHSFVIEQVRSDASPNIVANHTGDDQMVAPGRNINYTITRPYPAGLWRVYAVASMVNSTGEDREERYFTALTEQELFNKQALHQTSQYNLILTILGVVSAGAAIGGAIINHRHNNRVRTDTMQYTNAQLKLMQESNELTKGQLRLKDEERRASLGEPTITILNYTPSHSGRSEELRMYPDFRNEGKVDARNINIHYKVFPQVVALDEIVKHERDKTKRNPGRR